MQSQWPPRPITMQSQGPPRPITMQLQGLLWSAAAWRR